MLFLLCCGASHDAWLPREHEGLGEWGTHWKKVTSSLILKIKLIKSMINGIVLVVREAAWEMEV